MSAKGNGERVNPFLRRQQILQAAISSTAPDVKLVRNVTNMITRDASIIPVYEGGEGRVRQSYVVADYNQRGSL
jgi:hypothetical protein